MIEIKNINKSFGNHTIFEDFSLNVKDGEFLVIEGTSGSGKTTLLNMIGGIEEFDKGSIWVDGIDVSRKKYRKQYYRNTVGFLFQNYALIDNKTVFNNLNIVKENARSNISIEEALKIVGLESKINEKVYKLSGGEQQRIALARLMLKKCKIILADEPTGSLDTYNTNIVMDILHHMNEEGKTIIIVTHNKDIIKREKLVISLN